MPGGCPHLSYSVTMSNCAHVYPGHATQVVVIGDRFSFPATILLEMRAHLAPQKAYNAELL